MAEINSDADVDTLIWSTLQGSTCAQDYLDFIRHASGRPAPYEQAFLLAERYWRPVDDEVAGKLSPSKFPQIIAAVQARVDAGNPVAMLHLGQFFTHGIGMKADEAAGQAWLRRGTDLGNPDCMIFLGHSLRKTDRTAAQQVLEHAVSLGHHFAHLELADIDPQRRLYHLEQALKSENPYAYALYGEHLVSVCASNAQNRGQLDANRQVLGARIVRFGIGHLHRDFVDAVLFDVCWLPEIFGGSECQCAQPQSRAKCPLFLQAGAM